MQLMCQRSCFPSIKSITEKDSVFKQLSLILLFTSLSSLCIMYKPAASVVTTCTINFLMQCASIEIRSVLKNQRKKQQQKVYTMK